MEKKKCSSCSTELKETIHSSTKAEIGYLTIHKKNTDFHYCLKCFNEKHPK